MSWREALFRAVGPGMLPGMKLGDWLRVLRDNRFRIRPGALPKALLTSLATPVSSLVSRIEEGAYDERLAAQPVTAPLFVLGHWRSGTTHLHNLLGLDERFAYPRFIDVMLPHTFLKAGRVMSATFGMSLPATRFGLDDVPFHADAPFEEDFALAIMTTLSPYMSWVFPDRAAHYDRFLTLDDASPDELRTWKEALVRFLRKVELRYGRPLVLKSPPHTARLRLLTELFPDARFVHIHRHPFEVYDSTRRLHATCRRYFSLQGLEYDDRERVLSLYEQTYRAFFRDRASLPAGRFVELSFEQLRREPMPQLERIYDALQLPPIAAARPAFERYLAGQAAYKPRTYAPPPDEVRRPIVERWRPMFEAWNYPT